MDSSTTLPATISTSLPHVDEHVDKVTHHEAPTLSTRSSLPKGASPTRTHCVMIEKFNPLHPEFKEKFPYAKCKTCEKEFPAHTKIGGTSNTVNHLKFSCVNCPIYEGKKKVRGQSTLSQESMGAPLVPHTFNKKRSDKLLCEFVIRDEKPFRIVEGKGFRRWVHDLQPKYTIPDKKKVALGVFDLFLEEKAKIMSVIGNCIRG
ncbi:hypothetical protein ACHQM5_023412 [Ranunculus cassubicifolius]